MKKFDVKGLAQSFKGQPSSKVAFKNGTMASVLTAVVLVCVVLVNLVMNSLPSKYTQFDLSASGLYSIGDTTKQLLDGLSQDVTFYYLAQTGQEDQGIVTFLNRYTEENKHLHWEQKDPAIYPTFAQQYNAQNASQGSIIVVSGDRSKVVDAADIYTYDYSNYYTTGSYDMQFDGEQQLTSAVYYVTNDNLPKVYVLTGHGEQSLTSEQQNALNLQNVQVESLSLVSTEAIPDDAAAVLLAGPTVDYTADDITVLRNYLDKGGNLMVITDSSVSTPNLSGLLAEYGLSAMQGIVVEGDSQYHARGYNYYLLPQIQTHDATSGLSNLYVLLPYAQAIQTTAQDGITVESLLKTSSSAYNKAAGYNLTTTDKEDGDQVGSFDLAVAATKTLDDDKQAKLIWVTSAALLDQNINQAVSGGNNQFLLGCMSWLSGQDSSILIAASSILIAAKSMSNETLTINAAQASFWGSLTTIALPVICLIAGAVITIKRRQH